VQTGIGAVAVRQPRARVNPFADESGVPTFTSRILPPYLRRTRSIEELVPWPSRSVETLGSLLLPLRG
jgi:hypothetical protein